MEITHLSNDINMNQGCLFEKAIKTFNKSWKTWDIEDKNIAFATLNKFDFFRRKSNETDLNNLIQSCLKKIKLESLKPGQPIYHIGDDSKKLYFIIKGVGIKCKLKPDEELERNRPQTDDKQRLSSSSSSSSKFINVLNMLGAGNKDENQQNIQKKLSQDKIKSNSRLSVLSKLKDLKDLIPSSINFDILPHLMTLKISEKYFKDDNCIIKFEKKVMENYILGENDIFFDQPYTSYIFSISDLYALSISKNDLNRIFDELKSITERREIFMKLLPQYNEQIIKKFCMFLEEKSYRINDIIYDQNDNADSLYFIKNGDVQLFKCIDKQETILDDMQDLQIQSEDKQYKRVLLTALSQNQFFGEEMLLHKKNREHKSIAASNIILFKLNYKIIRKNHIDLFHIIDWIKKNAMNKIEWRENRLKTLINKPEKNSITNNTQDDMDHILMTQRQNTNKIIKILRRNRTALDSQLRSNLKGSTQEKENDFFQGKISGSDTKSNSSKKSLFLERSIKEFGVEINSEKRQKTSNGSDSVIQIQGFMTNSIMLIPDTIGNTIQRRLPLIERIKLATCRKRNHPKSFDKIDTEEIQSARVIHNEASLQETLKEKFEAICKSSSSENLKNRIRSITKFINPVTEPNPISASENACTTPSDAEDCFPFTSPKIYHHSKESVSKSKEKQAFCDYKPPGISITSFSNCVKSQEKPRINYQASNKFMEARRKQDQIISNNIIESSIHLDKKNLTITGNIKPFLNKTNTFSNVIDNVPSPRSSCYPSKIPYPLYDIKHMNINHVNIFGSQKLRSKLCKSSSSIKLL